MLQPAGTWDFVTKKMVSVPFMRYFSGLDFPTQRGRSLNHSLVFERILVALSGTLRVFPERVV